MAMQLLERDACLERLNRAFERVHGARDARGACVLVHGEAGIGKTSLVQAFLAALPACASAPLVAGCEHLITPRPLGPLVDLAHRFAPSVMAALHEGSHWSCLFPRLRRGSRNCRRHRASWPSW